ncbi:MAG: hypothetical protein MZV70_33590 [Desulfobacterales bacterium]|nr:hypothetical protein [Desulfobacterales bacterium]
MGLGDSVRALRDNCVLAIGNSRGLRRPRSGALFVVLTGGEGTGAAGSVTAPVEDGLTLGVHPIPATGTCFPEPSNALKDR